MRKKRYEMNIQNTKEKQTIARHTRLLVDVVEAAALLVGFLDPAGWQRVVQLLQQLLGRTADSGHTHREIKSFIKQQCRTLHQYTQNIPSTPTPTATATNTSSSPLTNPLPIGLLFLLSLLAQGGEVPGTEVDAGPSLAVCGRPCGDGVEGVNKQNSRKCSSVSEICGRKVKKR